MPKKWSQVVASPDYQNLSSPDKAAAQAQYFDQVVKPQLSPEQVDEAHNQFYKQYPVTSQEAPQGTQETTNPSALPDTVQPPVSPPSATDEDKESVMYALRHPVESFGALGNDLALGATHYLTTNHSTGEEVAPKGAAKNWYTANMADPETHQNALASEKALKMGAQVAAYTGGAGVVEAAAMGLPKVASFVGSNVAGSLASQAVGDEGISAGQTALDVATAGLFHGVNKGIATGVYNLEKILPESLGGFSQTLKAADVANPAYVERVLQSGNPEAQQTFRTATTNEAGESILNPSQTMNTIGGKRYIAAEQRDLTRGDKSVFKPNLEAQKSGEGITRAVDEANPALYRDDNPLQTAAQDLVNSFKQQSNTLYNESKTTAQDLLNSKRITSLKLPSTKQVATGHLEANTDTGNIKLNAETRRTLTQFNKAKINNIDTLDNWKRTLSEKAQKAYRNGDHTSSQALRDTLNSLRGEADSIISRIDPTAGSIYRDADTYFSNSVGDFGSGKRSILGKIADTENPDTASKALVRGENAQFNTRQIASALNDSIYTGDLNHADILAQNLAQGLGSETRLEALRAATTGENFSNTKFINSLNRTSPQVDTINHLSSIDESAVNNALADSIRTTRNVASVNTPLNSLGANFVGRGIGGIAGSYFGGVGALVGQEIGGRAANQIKSGLIDRVMGTNKTSQKYINFLADPENAKAVQDILDSNSTLSAAKEHMMEIATMGSKAESAFASAKRQQAHNQHSSEIGNTPIHDEPVQHAQSASSKSATSFDPKITRLYKSLAHAETGGLDNRFIRTKAAEAGVSTAYGPAQLTVTTMKDFASRHGQVFNARERDYISRFIQQGEQFKHADKNDPVFGYGGSGVLNSPEDQKLYANVVRKMLTQKVKDNGGSYDKTVYNWRGNDNDSAYFEKVKQAWDNS